VAALLEIAEHLSLVKTGPDGRCVYGFDAERWDAWVLLRLRAGRTDDAIAAVVNVDLLGRNLLDAVGNSLLVVGAEQYPDLERR
jgi:hypothetical protein